MDKDGEIIRYYADGGVAYSKELKQYVTIDGFDKEIGYFAKIKSQDLERKLAEIED